MRSADHAVLVIAAIGIVVAIPVIVPATAGRVMVGARVAVVRFGVSILCGTERRTEEYRAGIVVTAAETERYPGEQWARAKRD